MCFSPDGRKLAVPYGDSAAIWDVATQKEVRRLRHPDFGGLLSFVSDETCIVYLMHERYDADPRAASLLFWDVGRDTVTTKIRVPSRMFTCGTLLPGATRLAVAEDDAQSLKHSPTITMWDIATGSKLQAVKVPLDSSVTDMVPVPVDQLLTKTKDDCISLWDLKTSAALQQTAVRERIPPSGISIHPLISAFSVSPNGEYLAYRTYSSGKRKLWKTREFFEKTER